MKAEMIGLIEAAGALPCSECEHPIRYHIYKHGCEIERGDGYVGGKEYMEALGPCCCKGGTDQERTLIASIRNAQTT